MCYSDSSAQLITSKRDLSSIHDTIDNKIL